MARSSRRGFIQEGLAAAGAVALGCPGCQREADARAPTRRHKRATKQKAKKKTATLEPRYLALARSGKLERLAGELWQTFKECRCCPRQCKKNRRHGQIGECKATSRVKVYSAAPHFGEEKPLVGQNGSGTIFFSNCHLHCVFCFNWDIAHRGDGTLMSDEALATLMLRLQKRGCHNINLVTPTHVVPNIVRALNLAVKKGLRIPLVYNTGGYDSVKTIKKLRGVIDVYMPDFKFQDGKLAAKYARKCADYPWVAAAAIKEMHRQVGDLVLDHRGVAQRGLILRHLVMPNNVAGTDRFVKFVARELSRDTYVNIMAQYRPAYQASKYPGIARRITRQEWARALAWAWKAGLRNQAD